MTAKLQSLADALAKNDPGLTIVDTIHFAGGADERRETRVMRGGTTVGYLADSGNGRWSFTAPDEAAFNDVSPVAAVLAEENVKLGVAEDV